MQDYTNFGKTLHESKNVKEFVRITTTQNVDLGKSLFYAIKQKDWKLAFYLLDQGAEVRGVYEYEKGEYISTISLLIQIMSEAAKTRGHKVLQYTIPDRLLNLFIAQDIDLRDLYFSSKYRNKSPLFIALKTLNIQTEAEIFLPKNVLIRKLVINGATLRKHMNDKRHYNVPWFDIDQVRNYLLSSEKHRREVEKLKIERKKKIAQQQLSINDQQTYYQQQMQNYNQKQLLQEQEEQSQQKIQQQNEEVKHAIIQQNQYNNVNAIQTHSFKKLKSEICPF